MFDWIEIGESVGDGLYWMCVVVDDHSFTDIARFRSGRWFDAVNPNDEEFFFIADTTHCQPIKEPELPYEYKEY